MDSAFEHLSPEDQIILLEQSLQRDEKRAACEQSLAEFFRFVWSVLEPGRELSWNWTIDVMCQFLEDFSRRKFHRGIINIPPRGTKSLLVSVAYPLWVWIQPDREARYGGPGHQFLTLAHSQSLATRDSEKARIVLESPEFKALWGDRVKIQQGQNEKANYVLVGNGHRNSFGLTSKFMGRGGDTITIDDANDPENVYSDLERQNTIDSYRNKVVSRLNDRNVGGILVIMQRLHEMDLTGYLLQSEGHYHPELNPRGWMQLVIPMEFEVDDPDSEFPVNPAGEFGYKDPRTEPGELMWPERFPLDQVEHTAEKEYGGRDSYAYSGQFQQRPAPAAGGIIKKHYWQRWPENEELPHCPHVFLSWDTAFSEKDSKHAAFSAMTAWGVFYHEQRETYALMVLGCWYGRASYPELKKVVKEQEEFFEPHAHLIEKAASGHSLLQDLRRAHTPKGRRVLIRSMKPRQLGDKETRAHVASGTFHGGLVYVPTPKHVNAKQVKGEDLGWVKKLIDAVAVFPNGAPPSADITDTVTQAIIYLQQGWWINHPDDEAGMNYVGAEPDQAEDDEYDPLFDDEDDGRGVVRYGYG